MAADNLYVVIGAVVIVLALQLYAFVAVRRRLTRYQRELHATEPSPATLGIKTPPANSPAVLYDVSPTRRQMDTQGTSENSPTSPIGEVGASRTDASKMAPSFEWLEWLERRLESAKRNREPVTREAALAELDRILDEDREHVMLQRIGIGAPLVGVLVTALAFFTFRVPEPPPAAAVAPAAANAATIAADATMALAPGTLRSASPVPSEAARRALAGEAILTSIRPLASGVCVGAVLAILNQFLLFSLGNRFAGLRRQVRVWMEERQEVRGEFVDAATAGALTANAFDAVRNLYFVADRQAKLTDTYQNSIRQLVDATKSCQGGADSLRRDVGDLQTFFQNCRATMQSLRDTVTVVGPKSISAAEGLDGVVKRLDDLVQGHLGPAIDRQSKLSDVFGNVADNVGQFSERIGAVAALSLESFERFRATWDQHVVPAQKSFQEGATQLCRATDTIAERVNSFASTLDRTTERVGGVAETLDKPVAALSEAVEIIRVSVASNINSVLESQRASAAQWQQAAGDVAASAQTWKGSVEQSTSAIQQQRDAFNTLRRSLEEALLPTLARVEQAAAKFEQASNALSTNIQASQAALEGSTLAIRGVPEATKSAILELQACASQFSNAIRGDFATAAHEYAALTSSLRSAVDETNRNNSAIAASTAAFAAVAQSQAKVADETHAASASARVAADALAQGTQLFQHSLDKNLLPVHERMDRVAQGIESAVAQLAKFLTESVKPANDQLRVIQQLAQGVNATLASLKPLADLRQPIEQLTAQVHQLNRTASAYSNQPTHGTGVVNRVKHLLSFGRNGTAPPTPPPPPPLPPSAPPPTGR